jgi:hypothetical protein
MLNVLNLSFTDTILDYQENRPGDPLRIDIVTFHLPLDSSEELVSMALLDWLPGWIPTLVIEATDEHWQLRRELRGLVNREPVPKRMQRSPQSRVRFLPVCAVHYLHQVFKPDIGFVYCPVENFKPCGTHRILSVTSPGERFAKRQVIAVWV